MVWAGWESALPIFLQRLLLFEQAVIIIKLLFKSMDKKSRYMFQRRTTYLYLFRWHLILSFQRDLRILKNGKKFREWEILEKKFHERKTFGYGSIDRWRARVGNFIIKLVIKPLEECQ